MKPSKIKVPLKHRAWLAWKIIWGYPMGLTETHYFFNLTPEGAHARVAHETKNWQLIEVAFKAFKSDKVKKQKNRKGVAW